MKKLSLVIAALALVLGITQCKKQEDPVGGKVITQKVTFTTSFGDGSKLGIAEGTDEAAGTLNLSWEVGDEIKVTDGAGHESELTCTKVSSDGLTGTFEGEITYESGQLTFTVGTEPDYMNQHFTTITESGIYLVGKSDFVQSGDYEVDMALPYAILKVDLADLAPESGSKDVSVKIGDATEPVAVVTGVKTDDHRVYLLLLLTATEPTPTTLTFSNETKTITKTYTLAPNGFYTAGGNGGYAPVEPDAPATPKFTVADGKTVEFAPGNLYWDGSAFKFEADQWGFANSWNANHVSHFLWSPDKDVAVGTSTSVSGSTSDVFFTNATQTTANPGFQVDGETGTNQWRTLSNAEWNHLLNIRTMTYDKPRYTNKTAGIVIGSTTYNGIFIYPDDYNGNQVGSEGPSNWADINNAGIVFLPAAGRRWGTGVDAVGSCGYFRSSTPHVGNGSYAHRMYFNSDGVTTDAATRSYGYSVRLVRDVK